MSGAFKAQLFVRVFRCWWVCLASVWGVCIFGYPNCESWNQLQWETVLFSWAAVGNTGNVLCGPLTFGCPSYQEDPFFAKLFALASSIEAIAGQIMDKKAELEANALNIAKDYSKDLPFDVYINKKQVTFAPDDPMTDAEIDAFQDAALGNDAQGIEPTVEPTVIDSKDSTKPTSGQFPWCGKDGGTCICSGNVRYGAGSNWSDAKFSPGSIACNSGVFGDPAPGVPKSCQCMQTYYKCADDGDACTCSGTVRYGAGSTWASITSEASVVCNKDSFGQDPLPGMPKSCECAPTLTSCADDGGTCACSGYVRYGAGVAWADPKFAPGTIGCNSGTFKDLAGSGVKKSCLCEPVPFLKCADEGGTCSCLGNVRFGAGSTWTAIKPSTGSIACIGAAFGQNPLPGVFKTCQCASVPFSKCADEGGDCACMGSVRFGSGSKWTDPTPSAGSIACNSAVFGDSSPPAIPKGFTDGLYARYTYQSFDPKTKTWSDISGNNRHGIGSGDFTTGCDTNARGMAGQYCSVRGGTGSRVVFKDAIPAAFTICSVSRYAGPTRLRILNADGNWLHGHWGGQVGVAYYEGWKTSQNTPIAINQDDFVIFCGENAAPSSFIANGVQVSNNAGGGGGARSLAINDLGCCGRSEASDWAVGEIAIWNRVMSKNEMAAAADYFRINGRSDRLPLQSGTGQCACASVPFSKCADDGGNCQCIGSVRFGAGTKWTDIKKSSWSVACNSGVFGDPAPGVPKSCQCAMSWSACAEEGETCSCSGYARYGAGNAWTEAKQSPGSITCNSGSFGDPLPGIRKSCQCNQPDPGWKVSYISVSGGDWVTATCPAGSKVATCGGLAVNPPYISQTISIGATGTECIVGGHGGNKVASAICAPVNWAGFITNTMYPNPDEAAKLSQRDWVTFLPGPSKGIIISGGCRAVSSPYKLQGDYLDTTTVPGKNAWTCGGHGGAKEVWAVSIPQEQYTKYNCEVVVKDVGDWGRLSCPNSKIAFGCGCLAVSSPYLFQENRALDLYTCQCGGHGGNKKITAVCCSNPASIALESIDQGMTILRSGDHVSTGLVETSNQFLPRWTKEQTMEGMRLAEDQRQYINWVINSGFKSGKTSSMYTILSDFHSLAEANTTCDYKDPLGTDYRGNMRVAYDGTPCLQWPADWAIKFFGSGLRLDAEECAGLPTNSRCYEACLAQTSTNNFCRNPVEKKKPFCMTALPPTSQSGKFDIVEPYFKECNLKLCPDPSCTHQFANGTDYDGKVSYSMTMAKCLAWTTNPQYAARATTEHWANFCRNPGGEKLLPWCLVDTADNKAGWAYCDVRASCLEKDDYLIRLNKARNV